MDNRQSKIGNLIIDNSLIVACYVYHCSINYEGIWFSKIVDKLGFLDKHQISCAVDECFDWMILHGEYGETSGGKAGYLLMLDEDVALPEIVPLYEKIKDIFEGNHGLD